MTAEVTIAPMLRASGPILVACMSSASRDPILISIASSLSAEQRKAMVTGDQNVTRMSGFC